MQTKATTIIAIASLMLFASTLTGRVLAQASPPIVIGQTAAFSGPNSAPTKEMTSAAQAYFESINAKGGVNGRKIVLESLDDAFDPKRTVENANRLIDDTRVMALMLSRGTANTEALLPILLARKTPMVAPVGTSRVLHDPPNRYLFNIRPTTAVEAKKAIEHLYLQGFRAISVVYTDDAFGKDTLIGAESAFTSKSLKPAALGAIPRGEAKVELAVKAVVDAKSEAVLCIGIARACATVVKQLKAMGSLAQVVSLSNTSSKAYVEDMAEHGKGVIVTQVMPHPFSRTTRAARELQQLCETAKLPVSYTTMEGFLAAKLVVEALRRADARVSRESLTDSLERMTSLDLGGFIVSYSANNRTASTFVELTMIGRNGTFVR
jgi:branched-chain amino acid transport system substrate-binding protein